LRSRMACTRLIWGACRRLQGVQEAPAFSLVGTAKRISVPPLSAVGDSDKRWHAGNGL
jgi:hypothetical protein